MAKRNAARDPSPRYRFDVPSAAQVRLGLWVNSGGQFEAKQSTSRSRDRVLGNYAAVYVSRGKGWFSSPPSGRFEVTPGTLFWLFPTVPHSYAPHEWWAEQWVIFGGEVAEAFERQGFISPFRPFVRVGDNAEIRALFNRMMDVLSAGGPLAGMQAGALTHQLLVTSHGLATGLLGPADAADPVVREVLKIIEREARKGLLPERLAERLDVGYSTLRRRFKQQTGYSVKEYILRVQLKHAKELLAYTRLSIDQVSREAGFKDAFYFSRLFRSREGMPPSTFRAVQERTAQA